MVIDFGLKHSSTTGVTGSSRSSLGKSNVYESIGEPNGSKRSECMVGVQSRKFPGLPERRNHITQITKLEEMKASLHNNFAFQSAIDVVQALILSCEMHKIRDYFEISK